MKKESKQTESLQEAMNINPLLYIVITWPQIQNFMTKEGFEENSHLINDDKGFGSSAYFVNLAWASKFDPYISLTPDELKELCDSWSADDWRPEPDDY